MILAKEQLLAEGEDLLRNAPPRLDILANKEDALRWFGRFSAVIRAWDRVIGRGLRQHQAEKVAQRKRIGSAPGDPALGVDAFEVANQQQSEIDPGGQAGAP